MTPGAGTAVLAERSGVTVVRAGDTVTKAHAPDTDIPALARRLAIAAHPAAAGLLLPPLPPARIAAWPDGRPATRWPYGEPIDPAAPDAVPWEDAGRLLARLHALPAASLGLPLPPSGAPSRVPAALRTLAALPPSALTEAASHVLRTTPLPSPAAPVLCHGDFHLGQLVRFAGGWRLIDVDDLGAGDPAWDLSRPAAWYAAGLLPAAAWEAFTGAYRPGWDPWPDVDVPARLMTACLTVRALERARASGRQLDAEERALAEACLRISRLSD
ncbi:aminoglycoside phosphotransferase family protein [Streptomyces sp. RFCAC02]|uniref:phosphotransferase family protein n=1 Tax=Streptomyces sp. RFCAC02 TaxID=2499143 RepID=UPI001F0FDC77|nr:aminoglycoside phosphotransferase family protein [Streptomyces sp. RFCAC02]